MKWKSYVLTFSIRQPIAPILKNLKHTVLIFSLIDCFQIAVNCLLMNEHV